MEASGDAKDNRHLTPFSPRAGRRCREAADEGRHSSQISSLLVALLLFLAFPAQAQERFLIERIDVRHLVHASAGVIRAESRLREGQQYDESELRDANNRIKRLPFVLDAAFKLERGSVRDAYVLVITVNETKSFFYLFDGVFYKRQRLIEVDTEDALLLGGRWFAGSRDVFHLAAVAHQAVRPFERDYSSMQGGYTRYGLLDDRAFATLTVDRTLGDSNGVKLLPGAVVGISLAPKRTLTLSFSEYNFGRQFRRDGRIFEARFAHNTTNHPFFPSEGILFSVAPVVARTDSAGPNGTMVHALNAGLDGHAAEYWPLTQRTTLAAIADAGMFRVLQSDPHIEHVVGYGSATLRLSRALHDPNESDFQDRAELSLRATSRRRDLDVLRRNSSVQANVAWVHRNAWGLVRLGLGYAW
jgi:hypothetical protein